MNKTFFWLRYALSVSMEVFTDNMPQNLNSVIDCKNTLDFFYMVLFSVVPPFLS